MVVGWRRRDLGTGDLIGTVQVDMLPGLGPWTMAEQGCGSGRVWMRFVEDGEREKEDERLGQVSDTHTHTHTLDLD